MEKWIVLVGVVEITITIIGLALVSAKSEGYTNRRLEEYDTLGTKFEAHMNDRSIHEKSMDAELIKQKFLHVESKIEDVNKEMTRVRGSVHDFRENMPTMLATALNLHAKGKGAS